VDLKDLKKINLEFILNLPVKIKIIVAAVIVVLCWVGYGAAFIYPKIASIKKVNAELKEKLETRNLKRKDAAALPGLLKEVARLEKELSYSMTVLPNTEEIPSIIKAVENSLRNHGLDILSFKPSAEVKRDFYAEIPIQLRFSGGYREIGEFCQTIGRYPRIINISNIALRSPVPKDNKVVLTVESKANTYRFLRPEEMPKEGPKGAKK